MGYNERKKISLAMLASGNGTNVVNFINYFGDHSMIEVALVISNKPDAPILGKAAKLGIPHLTIHPNQWHDSDLVLGIFSEREIDFVVLAGFLMLVPACLIKRYHNKIVNIHPALLPAYGGKGMYGMHVHKAVIDAREARSGITIHKVNENYDEGEVIFQTAIEVEPDDTAEMLAKKIHQLEYQHYPRVVEQLVLDQLE